MPSIDAHEVFGNIRFGVAEGLDGQGQPVKKLLAIDPDGGERWEFQLVQADAEIIGRALAKPMAPGSSIAGLAVPAGAMPR